MISSNGLLALPLLAALYLRLDSQRARMLLLLLAGAVTLSADFWLAGPEGQLKATLDLLLVGALLWLSWAGCRWLASRGAPSQGALAALIVLEITPLLTYKLLMAGVAERFLPPGQAELMQGLLPPLGLSVMTFQAVSYTVDSHRRQVPTSDWRHFGVYMSFFPHLAAGPILKASDFIAQLMQRQPVDPEDVRAGLWRIFKGLIKKLLLSDLIAKAGVAPVFADPQAFSSAEIMIATLAFTIQIYLDFSAYTDVVIGSARLLGLKLPENFDRPYQATSIAAYWRRWHMSLSAWVGHYVYRPLGGNRVVRWKIYRNVMISIVLLALWHGLTPNFLLYGLLHGSAVCGYRWLSHQPAWLDWSQRHGTQARVGGWVLTFAFVVMARILFKTPTFDDAATFWNALLHSELSAWPRFGQAFWICLGLGMAGCFAPASWKQPVQLRFERMPALLQGLALAGVLMLSAWLSDGQALAFIYRQF
ncbi:MAG: MBOAT family O-acyltransferase [Betaproteobacteria bacterium]